MRTKVTLILIFLNVALFFFIFRFERAWRTEAALQEARRRVLGSETADITRLAVSSTTPGGPSYELVRNRDAWMLTRPLDWPANEHAVRSIVQALQFLQNETSFSVADLAKNGQSLADYGLEHPKMTVTFSSGEGAAGTPAGRAAAAVPTTVLRIGDTTKVGNRLYVLSPDGTRIHVVSRSLVDVLSVPLDQLRSDSVFNIQVFEARALSVQSSGARVRIARREGGNWMFDTIVNARASKTQLDATINDLNALHVKSFPGTAPATLPSDAPSLRVTVDGNNRSETLFLGDPVPGTAAKGQTEYFAQLMYGNTVRAPVFTVIVRDDLLNRLNNASTELRERRVVDFDPAAVTSITLAAPDRPPVTLQRLDSNSPDSPWQLVRGTAATGDAQTQPADAAAVRQLIERLSLLSATQFESDAPSSAQTEAWGFNRPEREITIVTAAAPGMTAAPKLLQLGTDSAGAVYARVGPASEPVRSVYAVNVDLARDFPVEPKAWRDRTLRELPPMAHITALKLTDLTTKKVLFETKLDAAGKPATAPRDPAAVQTLVAALRTLRAKQFVRDGFVDRVMLGGDDRSWRYELDTTIALPAGGTEQTSTSTLYFTDRVGGGEQLAGSKEFNVVFELEQPVIDALWSLTYGPRDPGPQPEKQ